MSNRAFATRLGIVATVASGAIASAPAAIALCPAELPARIDAILSRPAWQRARWGIAIEELDTRRSLYAREAERYFLPASTAKLFSTAAALAVLGPEFRWQTVVRQSATSIYLVGGGDPTLTDADLSLLAARLTPSRGAASSGLVVVASPTQLPPTWEWEDVGAAYGVPAGDIQVNENAVTLTLIPGRPGQGPDLVWSDAIAARQWGPVANKALTSLPGEPYDIVLSPRLGSPGLDIGGSLPADNGPDRWDLAIPDPARYAGEAFARHLETGGIRVGRISVGTSAPPSAPIVARVMSPPLSEVLALVNQDSNNLYAEALVRALPGGSLEAAITALAALGVPPEMGHELADASGLSRHNLVAPIALVRLLQQLARGPLAESYRATLAVAGESGTLKRRFLGTPVAGNLQGKTGTMSGVTTLAGYLQPPDYSPLAVSIMLNQSPLPLVANRAAIDEIVLLVAELEACDAARAK